MSINQTFNSYYLEMGATEGFLKGEIKILVDKLRDKEEEIKKLKEIRDNREEKIADLEIEICKLKEENAELKSELSKFSDSFKKYRDYEKEELAESCYDLARENEKLKEEIGKLVMNGK